ncbi:pinopsin-like isoform X2 [Oenanthe melanoleuca]|uniref:pinopsin-like isoform X2 n=1 Tax=Oenanthe melanoleuca TaxID=2939378 RepID=UPI0024C183A3|nr:pinopsin-like isoform X2 [Oenanthe melanoleuca]
MEPPNGSSTPGPFDGPQWPHRGPRGLFVAAAALMALLVAAASLLNGLVVLVSLRHRRLRSPLNLILLNLALANLLVTACGSSVSLASNVRGFFAFGERLCRLEGFMVALTGLRTSCGPNWYTGGSNNNSYILSLFVTCFVMPLGLILFSYTNLLLTLRAAAAQQRQADTTQKAEREVTRMVVAMVVAFLTCWLPYTTFALVVATNKGIVIQPALASLPSYFSKTATVYNPIIYVFMNKQFQGCLLEMLCCGHHPRGMGKTSPAAPSPQGAAEGLRNKVTPSQPV